MANDVHWPSLLSTVEPPAIWAWRDGTMPCQWWRLPFDDCIVVITTASWADTTMCPARPVRRRAVTSAIAASAAASAVCLNARSPAAWFGGSSETPFRTVNPPAAPTRQVGHRLRRRVATEHDVDEPDPRIAAPRSRSRNRAVAGFGSSGPMTTSTPGSAAAIGVPRGVARRVDGDAALAGVVHGVPVAAASAQHVATLVLDTDDRRPELGEVLPGERRGLVAEVEHHDVVQERESVLLHRERP